MDIRGKSGFCRTSKSFETMTLTVPYQQMKLGCIKSCRYSLVNEAKSLQDPNLLGCHGLKGLRWKVPLPNAERFPQSWIDPLITTPKLLIFSSERSQGALIHQGITTQRQQGGPRLTGLNLQMLWNALEMGMGKGPKQCFSFLRSKLIIPYPQIFWGHFMFHLGVISFSFYPDAVCDSFITGISV